MSRHVFRSTYNGQPVKVQMGWDAPLQHYFMVVTLESLPTKSENDDNWPVYSNLGDSAISGGTSDLEYYWRKLDDLGIACAGREAINLAIKIGASADGENRLVRHPDQNS